MLQSILDFLCLSFLTCFEFCVIINIMSIFRNLCFLLLILAVPSSAVEIAQPQPDLDYETVGLFHREISNKGCEKNTPGKVHRIPGFRFAYQQTDMCEYYYPSHTALAFSVFYIEWSVKFGDENNTVKNALDELMVEYNSYQKKISRIYSIDGEYRPGPTVINGLTSENGKYIFVWSGTMPGRLYDTSLVHELVHVAIYAYHGGEHGDPDHEGPQYPGWTAEHTEFIKDTNRILEDMDL